MGCDRHGYSNPVYCPACDLETIGRMRSELEHVREQYAAALEQARVVQMTGLTYSGRMLARIEVEKLETEIKRIDYALSPV